MTFKFEILAKSKKSRARVGKIHTPHGTIDTPNFVAVGTNGTLKALESKSVEEIGLQLMFCNTYHLLLQPGTKVIKEMGGLHRFMNRSLPIITDSGGFQVFSLAFGSVHNELKGSGKKMGDPSVLKITEEGVLFRSYRDGAKILLTPETSIQAQKDLGADIIIPFDELPPYHIEKDDLKKSLARTHRWEKRSLEEHLRNPQNQAIYGVIHGGIDQTFRKESAETLSRLPFDGFAIGGSVGKHKQELQEVVSFTTSLLPEEKPVHLLGIGDLPSIRKLIAYGIDTFDSSYPTKAARHGLLFTKQGGVKIEQKQYSALFEPIEKDCTCYTCRHYKTAYLHHLFKAKELTALTLASLHNLHFMVEEMQRLRISILEESF